MGAILFWGIPLLVAYAMWYIITHPVNIGTVQANADSYGFSRMWITRYGGTFRTPGYKLKHADVMFVCPTKDSDKWKMGDFLVVDAGNYEFERDKYYLFRAGKTYRIAQCKAIDKISHMAPIFDGHETLITHDCLGRIVGVLRENCHVEMI